ncbi:MAG: methionine synthase [Oscillospiraceae bacterium]|nr:methionine synthase [Oscillospiraceae bacterium]
MIEKINRDEAFRYMGLKGEISREISDMADECEKRLLEAAIPRYYWVYAEISEVSEDAVTLKGYKLVLRGRDISAHLKDCFGVALLCATLGEGVDRLLRTVQAEDMAKALMVDALASAAAEQVCDAAENEIRDRFPGKYTTWRFSPGYGDFPLECQGDFLAAVNAMRTVGVFLTAGGLLTPTKSVTAVVGLSDSPVPAKRRGCGSCSMRESCTFRKSGGHC